MRPQQARHVRPHLRHHARHLRHRFGRITELVPLPIEEPHLYPILAADVDAAALQLL